MRADVIAFAGIDAGVYSGASINYVIRTPEGVLYLVLVDNASDVVFIKSSNNGITWSNPVLIYTGTTIALAVWYDRWSGIAGNVIHCVYTDSATANISYRSIDAGNSDALGTETLVFDGVSFAGGGALTIVNGRNGHIRVAGSIDAGAEDGAWSSADAGATWTDTIADPSEGATQDQYLLLPGWNADTADVMLIFWDASANEISVKRYDDSGNAWAETSIATTMADLTAGNGFPNMAAAVDLGNSRNILVAWSATDAANADLRCWIIDDTSITEVTNVVLNSADDQGICVIGIDTDTGDWYVFYGGKSDGSETFTAAMRVYYKVSRDSGTTWSAEILLSSQLRGTPWIACTPRFAGVWSAVYYSDLVRDAAICSALMPTQKARYQLGLT